MMQLSEIAKCCKNTCESSQLKISSINIYCFILSNYKLIRHYLKFLIAFTGHHHKVSTPAARNVAKIPTISITGCCINDDDCAIIIKTLRSCYKSGLYPSTLSLGHGQGGFLSRKKLMKDFNLMPHSYFQK